MESTKRLGQSHNSRGKIDGRISQKSASVLGFRNALMTSYHEPISGVIRADQNTMMVFGECRWLIRVNLPMESFHEKRELRFRKTSNHFFVT